MGNTESLQLKEGKHILEIDEKVLRDFQHYITVVDRTMTGFARSLDAMRASCKLPCNYGDEMEVNTQEQAQSRQEHKNEFDPQVVADLHQILYDCVADHEYVHMESVSKLFSFVLSISKDYLVFSQAEPFSFSVDRYLVQQKVVDTENGKQYYDLRIEALLKKIEDLKDTLKIAKEEVENLNKREEIYQKEKQTLKNMIEELEKNVAKLKSENEKEINENCELLTKIEEMENLVISLEEIEKILTGENEGHLRTINELQTTVSEQTVTTVQLREEINSLNAQNGKLSAELKKTIDEAEEYKNTRDKLQRNVNEVDMQVAELKEIRKNTELKQSLEEERTSNQDVIERMKEERYRHNTEKKKTEKKIKRLMEENENLRANQKEAESKFEALEIEMEMLKNKKIMHVQDVQPFAFSATTAKTDLFELIKNKMALKSIELNVIQISKASLVDLNIPLIINITRTSTFRKDKTIANRLKDYPEVTKKMVMVIYHHKDEKDLLNQVELNDYEAGKDLWGVFNLGFKNKIYRCTTNDNTIDGIVDFLLKESDMRYKALGETAL